MVESVLDMKLKNYPLIYREKLTMPKNINFGLELELDNVRYNDVYKLVRKNFGSNWKVITDKSLTLNQNAEIVTPVLQNNKNTWILLKKMGELLKKLDPSYDKCSFQINFDGDLLPTLEDKANFIKLYAMYEDIIYRFSKGEDLNYRDSLEMYASPIILALKGIMKCGDDAIVEMFKNQKRYGISFKTMNKDLIEFRTPNMTSNVTIWQNYILTFYYLLDFSHSTKFDIGEAEDYIDSFNKTYLLKEYELEKKEKALTFSKNIFNNDSDMCCFLHQYSKKSYSK